MFVLLVCLHDQITSQYMYEEKQEQEIDPTPLPLTPPQLRCSEQCVCEIRPHRVVKHFEMIVNKYCKRVVVLL